MSDPPRSTVSKLDRVNRARSSRGLTVRPPARVVVDHVVAGVQFLAELVDAVALGKPAGEPGDDHVVGLETELVGQHVRGVAGGDGLCGRAGRVRSHRKARARTKMKIKIDRRGRFRFTRRRFWRIERRWRKTEWRAPCAPRAYLFATPAALRNRMVERHFFFSSLFKFFHVLRKNGPIKRLLNNRRTKTRLFFSTMSCFLLFSPVLSSASTTVSRCVTTTTTTNKCHLCGVTR